MGEWISGSSGNPSGVYAATALEIYNSCTLQYLRVGYANNGIQADYCSLTNEDSQFINVVNPLKCEYGSSKIENVLIYKATGTAVAVSYGGITAENLTVHDAATFCAVTDGGLSLTNSLLISCTNMGASFSGAYNYTNSSDTGIFQIVGGGANYLATNCPAGITNAGTTNIDPTLLADLQTKTIWPPILYSNVTFTSNVMLSPQAARDTSVAPSLGYHYDPLDYVFGGCTADTNITFTSGTAVGWFRTTSGYSSYHGPHIGQGIFLQNLAIASFQGTEEAPDYWVRLDTVRRTIPAGAMGLVALRGETINITTT